MDVAGDRRTFRIQLTPRGRVLFGDMARQHETWIVAAFQGLSPAEVEAPHQLLDKVKQQHLHDLHHDSTPLEIT